MTPLATANVCSDIFKMGQSRALFCVIFAPITHTLSSNINWKSVDIVFGIWTWARRMVAAERPPCYYNVFLELQNILTKPYLGSTLRSQSKVVNRSWSCGRPVELSIELTRVLVLPNYSIYLIERGCEIYSLITG